jgi:hypothetical protein
MKISAYNGIFLRKQIYLLNKNKQNRTKLRPLEKAKWYDPYIL